MNLALNPAENNIFFIALRCSVDLENHFMLKNRYHLWKNVVDSISSEEKKVKVFEIGVWKGDFALHILSKCENIEKYFLIDPWRNLEDWNKPFNVPDSKFNEVYNQARKRLLPFEDKTIFLRGKTDEVIDEIDDNSIDFGYIDGDHTAKGITSDLLLSFPKIKSQGILGGDDYVEDIFHHDRDIYDPTMVKPVVDGFVLAKKKEIASFIGNENQFLIQKD